jgi:hypothetical protein
LKSGLRFHYIEFYILYKIGKKVSIGNFWVTNQIASNIIEVFTKIKTSNFLMTTNYHYIVMSQKDLLQNQVIEEILREKASYYNSRKKNPDYWIVISPFFLKEQNLFAKIKETKFYYQQKEKICSSTFSQSTPLEFYAALVSTDEEFMKWVKLRLGYFENIDQMTKNNHNATYVSDGIFGVLQTEKNRLKAQSNFLHPDILIEKYRNALEEYFLTLN